MTQAAPRPWKLNRGEGKIRDAKEGLVVNLNYSLLDYEGAALIVHAVNLLNSGVLDEAKAVLEKYAHDGQLQSFESRERFRAEAKAVLAKLEGGAR